MTALALANPLKSYTVALEDVAADDLPRVGGKGANLGALVRAGVSVPPGYCVTTEAFEDFIAALPDSDRHFVALEALDGNDVAAARTVAEAMREALENVVMPPAVATAVLEAWRHLGSERPLAVRSSATAEDLPGASFAGQQDTYLNIVGEDPLLDAVRRCWISLFTDRAVLYRARNRFGHRAVRLSVVVQQLVDPEISGILFTADPISGHRGIVSIDAGFGLGEALVSGLISADLYRVDRKQHSVLLAQPGDKAFAIRSVAGGGTRQEPLSDTMRRARALNDSQVLALAEIGERVEALYGGVPQDIEWCIAGGKIHVVQARPITSLFPVPISPATDQGLRIYLSFGHIQMMTGAMPRLAREVWQYFLPAGKSHAPGLDDPAMLTPYMVEAGSRIFLDATPALRVRPVRDLLLAVLGHVYEALSRGAATLTSRPEFAASSPSAPAFVKSLAKVIGPLLGRVPVVLLVLDPVAAASAADRFYEDLARAVRARITAAKTPGARVRQIAIELNAFFSSVRKSLSRLLAGAIAHRLLARVAQGSWADEVRDDVDRLLRGLPGNVTTQMDLAVGDLTDLVRPYPELGALLRDRSWSEIQTRWETVPGGTAFAEAFERFLARYGDRGASEIDVSRARWRDEPSLLFRAITGGLSGGEAGVHRRQHEAQVVEAEAAEKRLVAAAGRGLVGTLRRWWVQRLCRVARAGLGLREHPKFALVRTLGVARAEILAAAAICTQRGQMLELEHVWHLGFDELAAALDQPSLDLREKLVAREAAFRVDQARKPPVVISSDGETPTLAIERKDLPPGALPGTAASNGVVEGVARVIRDPDRETLHAGEILVAPFTDPGWTPLFVHASGVVTEVGGLMTHGAVVAREYGIPAVVSVEGATERIHSGQRIRVDGTRGFVELLESP